MKLSEFVEKVKTEAKVSDPEIEFYDVAGILSVRGIYKYDQSPHVITIEVGPRTT